MSTDERGRAGRARNRRRSDVLSARVVGGSGLTRRAVATSAIARLRRAAGARAFVRDEIARGVFRASGGRRATAADLAGDARFAFRIVRARVAAVAFFRAANAVDATSRVARLRGRAAAHAGVRREIARLILARAIRRRVATAASGDARVSADFSAAIDALAIRAAGFVVVARQTNFVRAATSGRARDAAVARHGRRWRCCIDRRRSGIARRSGFFRRRAIARDRSVDDARAGVSVVFRSERRRVRAARGDAHQRCERREKSDQKEMRSAHASAH